MLSVPYSLVTVGYPAKFSNGHRLLLDVVLGKEARLTSDHLLDRGWDDQVIDVIIG